MTVKQISQHLQNACEELLQEKLIYEFLFHQRRITKLKMCISAVRGDSVICLLDNPRLLLGIYKKINLAMDTNLKLEEMSNFVGSFVTTMLLENCRPARYYWPRRMDVKEIKVTGEFPCVY